MPFPVPTPLEGGETAQSVADKFGVSIDALRVLNQFRTFAKGFDNIGPGDELDVPVKVSDTPAEKTAQNDVQAQRGAALVSLAGAFLSNNPDNDAARSMVTGIASAKASQEIQDWLGKFGSARVSVNSDRHFSLKGSSLEMLYPLYDTQDNMFFTQGALHRTDDRNQANIGLGWRHFVGNNWMTGGNLFVDHDLSRSHTRVGVGAEYWRDYLRLGANGYIGVTRWRNSPDVEDYEERPADGWDVRAEGYLPAYPQLGAKLIYEQYYGDEVGLFGKDDRQKNPHAFTVGVNYTPVPLLTFSAEQRQGKAGENDTRFGVEMNYQLGIPWQHQINPDGLAAMRSLAGSRYALVERNNNIVLEYRKKDVISLKMTDLVTGYAGEQKSLGVSVNSKYGLEHIDWSASPLIAAGGKIVQNGKDWTVVMPDYRSGGEASNSYTVSSVAVDKKGNVSGRAETQVTVMQAAIDTTTSLLSPAVVTLPADGTSQQEFVLNVNDKEGLPVDIAENEISVEKTSGLRGSSNATVSSFTRRAAGEYVMTVTSGTVPETFTITPSARNTKFASADVKLTADTASARVSTLTADQSTAIADGKTAVTFTATVKDATGNVVPNTQVTFSASGGKLPDKNCVTTDNSGVAKIALTSTEAGKITVTAKATADSLGKEASVTFSGPELGALVGRQVVGKSFSRITISSVVTFNGKPVQGVEVMMNKPLRLSALSDSKGRVSFELTSENEVSEDVIIQLNHQSKKTRISFVRSFCLDLETHWNYDGGFWDNGGKTLFEMRGHGVNTVELSASTTSYISGYKWDGALIRSGISNFVVTDEMRTLGGYCHLEGDYIQPSMVCEEHRKQPELSSK